MLYFTSDIINGVLSICVRKVCWTGYLGWLWLNNDLPKPTKLELLPPFVLEGTWTTYRKDSGSSCFWGGKSAVGLYLFIFPVTEEIMFRIFHIFFGQWRSFTFTANAPGKQNELEIGGARKRGGKRKGKDYDDPSSVKLAMRLFHGSLVLLGAPDLLGGDSLPVLAHVV